MLKSKVKIKNKIKELKYKINKWDELSKHNENNKHNLSTSERQDWVDELNDLFEEYFN